jgi:hypothetical protein
MSTFRPRLLEAVTAGDRMGALCEFIEFWLGPRRPSFGEAEGALDGRPLPMPLRRLYGFAGRWPHREDRGTIEHVVPALSHQDSLVALHELKSVDGGKVVFLWENQGNWDCRTLPEGDDPPVWCHGDHEDEHGNWFRGERLVCESLSSFLVTFTLQELTLGSLVCLGDEGLKDHFLSVRDMELSSAVPIWLEGTYVYGSPHNYYLWGEVLVAEFWGDPFLAANHEGGIEFLCENQGSIDSITLHVFPPWSLDVQPDGSARLRYLTGRIDEGADAPAGTFDFVGLIATLTALASDDGHHERSATVTFHRRGQAGGVRARYVREGGFVTTLFHFALLRATAKDTAVERRFEVEWPL